jgi:hypoxanthine phosphoribosyltransferase
MDYTFEMFQRGVDHLVDQVDGDYQYIIGVTRGGLIPAVFLSHRLGIPMISINWSTRDSGIKSIGDDTIKLLMGKKVLIVEDIVDSGKTLTEMIDSLRDVCSFHVAALIYNTSQNIVPEFYDVTIDRIEYAHWINFFWEDKER